MIFPEPIPFREAMESREVRQLLPTDFRTKLLATIPAELRERALFMAGVTNVETLQMLDDGLNELMAGEADRATVRARLMELGRKLKYQPVPGEEDTLTDVFSFDRLNLAIDTNLQFAQDYGHREQGRTDELLWLYPCWELVDTNPGSTENRRNWPARWAAEGGEFFAGRMIARKDDPIWTRISRFGLDYGPLDFNTYHEKEDVIRSECIELGVIEDDEAPTLADRDFNTDL